MCLSACACVCFSAFNIQFMSTMNKHFGYNLREYKSGRQIGKRSGERGCEGKKGEKSEKVKERKRERNRKKACVRERGGRGRERV